ncbi:DUF1360 domain-containing protein [Neobacillus mesonae]|uniref:DUF1360 domain-containing protein n=1 Tax=Neobacillus mesonae TaxID=1193713 RepID=UPI0020405809|nr:DUF1360 domain-containing protein [Neobacillus mesonae]MCM3568569.1 DUF1360 domain-containing protein [Neobacillus mesonae]
MFHVTWIDLIIIILASFRFTHLIVFDDITSIIRKPFVTTSNEKDALGELVQNIEIRGTGIRHFIGSILSCYWCCGLWCSIVVVLIYFYFPVTFPIFLILAVAGAAAVIESKI